MKQEERVLKQEKETNPAASWTPFFMQVYSLFKIISKTKAVINYYYFYKIK